MSAARAPPQVDDEVGIFPDTWAAPMVEPFETGGLDQASRVVAGGIAKHRTTTGQTHRLSRGTPFQQGLDPRLTGMHVPRPNSKRAAKNHSPSGPWTSR